MLNPEYGRIAFSIDETAKALGCSRATIYRWANMGLLQVRRIGGRAFVLNADLEALLQSAEPIGDEPTWLANADKWRSGIKPDAA